MAESPYDIDVRIVRESAEVQRVELPGAVDVRVQRGAGGAGAVPGPAPTGVALLIAALGASLADALGSALEARGLAAASDRLSAVATGTVESEARVPVLRHVHVTYYYSPASEEDKAVFDALLAVHMEASAVYRSVHPQLRVTASGEYV